ncbi:hypothetical protein XENTR_v10004341 [Xenopus tropicalis]|nr:hypothetical protein XENTR_v10004341 [Xenopus tropicalis]
MFFLYQLGTGCSQVLISSIRHCISSSATQRLYGSSVCWIQPDFCFLVSNFWIHTAFFFPFYFGNMFVPKKPKV